MKPEWLAHGTRTRRGSPAITLLLAASMLSPTAAFASDLPSPNGPLFAYRSGVEPGSILAGRVLPLDWSLRESPCGGDVVRYHLEVRVTQMRLPALCPSDVSDAVIYLQELLTDKKFYREATNGIFDAQTRHAVATFHKVVGRSHSNPETARAEWIGDPPPEDWTVEDWELLLAYQPRPPKYRVDQPDRVEVDIGHQVLYLINRDEVSAIIPVSTGAGMGRRACGALECNASVTPRTNLLDAGSTFHLQHNYGSGWSPRPGSWSIYKAIFYRGNYGEWNYGIHGYREVPHYPASHGCIRVTMWDMDYLRPDDGTRSWGSYVNDSLISVGMPVHVWDV